MVDLVKLEELAKWHNEKADAAMNNLSCGSENWEYRYAHKEADFHRGFATALSSARAEIERLREALKPFAFAGDNIKPKDGKPGDPCMYFNYFVCTLGDLHRAAALIRGQEE